MVLLRDPISCSFCIHWLWFIRGIYWAFTCQAWARTLMSLGSWSEKDPGYFSKRNERMLQGADEETFAEVWVAWEKPGRDGAVPQASDDRAVYDCLEAFGGAMGATGSQRPGRAGLPGERDAGSPEWFGQEVERKVSQSHSLHNEYKTERCIIGGQS